MCVRESVKDEVGAVLARMDVAVDGPEDERPKTLSCFALL